MPTVEKVSGGRVYIRPLDQRFEIGDRANVSADEAEYLTEERGDFALVDSGGETYTPDTVDQTPDEDDEADVCGYQKDGGSVCQRSPGWGRDADTGPCKDHVGGEE